VAPVAGGWEAPKRLGGFAKVALAAGARQSVSVTVDPRLLATWDEPGHQWKIAGGAYKVMLADSATAVRQSVTVTLPARTLPATWRAK
jgi:beta-glucosidase